MYMLSTYSTHNHLSHNLLQLCLYLGKRDFVDHVESVDSVGTFYFTLETVLFLTFLIKCVHVYSNHLSIHVQYFNQPVISLSDGVLKIDPSDLNGRKGVI